MIGVTRGISTLVGAAVAGILLWFATQIGTETSSEYWATYGLIAAAGLTMALSQILGGWTKWGWPRFSLGVFLIGFLPVLVAGGWVLFARQPADWMNTSNWSRDLGIYGARRRPRQHPAGDRVRDRAHVRVLVRHRRAAPRGRREEHVARDSDAPLTADRDTPPPAAVANEPRRRRATATPSGRP